MINPLAKTTTSIETVVLKYWKEPEFLGETADFKSGLGNG